MKKKRYRIVENGPWKAVDWRDTNGEIVVASDDFTHDVHLEISGDFYNADEKMAYARVIARRLNAFQELEVQKRAQKVFTRIKNS